MSDACVATLEDALDQLVVRCWPFEAPELARSKAQAALERVMRGGLEVRRAPDGSARVDTYAVCQAVVPRAGELPDEAWRGREATVRRTFLALDDGPRLRFRLRREWLKLPRDARNPLVLRLPLPLREAASELQVRLPDAEELLVSRRDEPGRIELRVHPKAGLRPSLCAELSFEFQAAEQRAPLDDSAPLDPAGVGASEDPDALWLAPREGLIACTPAIGALAARLAAGCANVTQFALAAWNHLFAALRLADVHRDLLHAADPLGAALASGWADCAVAAALLVALCRCRGIPARLVHGYLVTPGLPSQHSWCEVRLAPNRWAPMDFACWEACAGNARDPLWARLFFGRVNPRLICELEPRQFTGWGSARPPPRWIKLHRLIHGGIEQTLRALPGGEPFLRDQVFCERS